MRLGLVARTDSSGLAAQSEDFAKHLKPAATLVVHMTNRGPSHKKFPNELDVDGPLISDEATVRKFVEQSDILLSIETYYGSLIIDVANELNVPSVRLSNPELYKPEGETRVLLPTFWEQERLPNAIVIDQPIEAPPERVKLRRQKAEVLLHQRGMAMLDRDGSDSFIAALGETRHKFRVIFRGQREPPVQSKHEFVYDGNWLENRWDAYDESIDVLVHPRRYGGLALPMLEGMSCGLAVVTSDLLPQRDWLPPEALIPTSRLMTYRMVGGRFSVNEVDHFALAERLDLLAEDAMMVERLSQAGLNEASRRNWGAGVHHFQKVFAKVLHEFGNA